MTPSLRSLLLKIFGSATRKGPTETYLSLLMNISSRKSSRPPSFNSELKDVAVNSVAVTSCAKTYCSRTVLTHIVAFQSGPSETQTVEWRTDFVGPDYFHVKQAVRESRVFDEWVTLGAEHYLRPALWLRGDGQRNPILNSFLMLGKYLHVMGTFDPSSVGTVRHLTGEYLCLEYELDAANDLAAFSEFLMSYVVRPQGTCHVSVWVDRQSLRVVKGKVHLKGQTQGGSVTTLDLQQAFASFNEEVHITRPRVGLEPKPDSPGTYIVVDNLIYPVPFHW